MSATTAVDLDVPAESTVRRANGVDLHVVAAGDLDDPLVVALHGFPEFNSLPAQKLICDKRPIVNRDHGNDTSGAL